MTCLHGGDPTLAIFPMQRPTHEQHTNRILMGTSLRSSDQKNHVMTVGVDTVLPLNNVHGALIEDIYLAWVMMFRTTTLNKIITGSPHV
jgi:hypothetical protein